MNRRLMGLRNGISSLRTLADSRCLIASQRSLLCEFLVNARPGHLATHFAHVPLAKYKQFANGSSERRGVTSKGASVMKDASLTLQP
jgi:hypothetical protein